MKKAYLLAILAALFAAINVPFSKWLLTQLPPMLLSGLVFIGAAIGTGLFFLIGRLTKKDTAPFLKGKDFLYIELIGIMDTIANCLLFYGISLLNGETASLLQSFEIVATAIIAFFFFKEKMGWRTIVGILFVFGASCLLSFEPGEELTFNPGALMLIGATICWGVDNNLAKKISNRDVIESTFFKCLTPGVILTIVGLCLDEFSTNWAAIAYSFLDGFFAYAVSIVLLLLSFRTLSASIGTALYALNPFAGAIYSLIIFPSTPKWNFYASLSLLVIGELFVTLNGLSQEKEEKEKAEKEKAEKEIKASEPKENNVSDENNNNEPRVIN